MCGRPPALMASRLGHLYPVKAQLMPSESSTRKPCAPYDLVEAEGDENEAQVVQRNVGGLQHDTGFGFRHKERAHVEASTQASRQTPRSQAHS